MSIASILVLLGRMGCVLLPVPTLLNRREDLMPETPTKKKVSYSNPL